MIKFMKFKYPREFVYVMVYDLDDISDEFLNFLQLYNEEIFNHMCSVSARDCLLHEEEMNSIKGFLDISNVDYKSSDETYAGD